MINKNIIIILTASFLMHGCTIPKYKDFVEGWAGAPIQELISIKNRDGVDLTQKYQLDNGNDVYVYTEFKRCFIHWEVNKAGIIVGVYNTEGDCNF
jgi:hypothetical protein